MKIVSALSMSLYSLAVTAFASVPAADQQKQPLVVEDTSKLAGEHPANSLLFLQYAPADKLFLSIDESFDSNLNAAQIPLREGALEGLNRMSSFSHASGWGKGSELRWHVYVPKPGKYTVSLDCEGLADGKSLVYTQVDGGEEVKFTNAQLEHELSFPQPGLYDLKIVAGSAEMSKGLQVKSLTLQGEAIKGAAVARARWRPVAAHGRFLLPEEGKVVPEIWVVEQEGAPSKQGYYAPVTTPFGYYGCTRSVEGYPRGVNFSLWSFGRGKDEPDLKKLSHLLAIGSGQGVFSGFSHEGTGVKIRGWNPFEGSKSQLQRFAVRKEVQGEYSVWSTYFWNFDTQSWQLYGRGKQWNKGKKGSAGFGVGTFVEVPGPPQRERSGDVKRVCRYRAWAIDASNKVVAATALSGEKGQSNRWRLTTQDGWAELGMGGIYHYPPAGQVEIRIGAIPDFLQEKHLKELRHQPCTVTLTQPKQGDKELHFQLKGQQGPATLTLYHGAEEGLTFAARWQHSSKHEVQITGEGNVSIPMPTPAPKHLRALLETKSGKAWMDESAVVEDKVAP